MGLVLRQSTINNGTNTITIKGSALSYIEGDSNFVHLLTNMSGSNVNITGSNVGILSTNTTINGTFKLPNITNSNNTNLITYNTSTGQLYYYNTASINVGTSSYINPLIQDVKITGSIFVSSLGTTLGQFIGNQNGYVEFSIRNTSTGISASGDIAVYADNGTTTNNYIDMGINNSGLSNTYFYGGTDFGNANDAYLYNVGGDLRIGNATSQAPFSQSLFIFSNPSARPDITITGSLFLSSSAATLGQFAGTQNGFVEFSIRNTSTGISASGDIAVYANDGTVSNNYIDMGINNSGMTSSYSYFGTNFGNAHDAYVYNVGGDLRIGNATSVTPFSQSFHLFSNPTATPNITMTGSRVGINKSSSLNATLDVVGTVIVTGSLILTGSLSMSLATGTPSSIVSPSGYYSATINGAAVFIPFYNA